MKTPHTGKKRGRIALIAAAAVFCMLLIAGWCLNRFAPSALYRLLYPQPEISLQTADAFSVGIEPGDHVAFGEYYGQPVVWTCVFGAERPVLLSDRIIDFLPYDDDSAEWETSSLRGYLNTGDVFRFGEGARWLDGEVTLLTAGQCKKLPDADKIKSPTPQAIEHCRTRFLFLRRNAWYWTRSGVSTNSLSVTAVTQTGGLYKSPAYDTTMGVCPVITLNAQTVVVQGGSGTAQQPYILR